MSTPAGGGLSEATNPSGGSKAEGVAAAHPLGPPALCSRRQGQGGFAWSPRRQMCGHRFADMPRDIGVDHGLAGDARPIVAARNSCQLRVDLEHGGQLVAASVAHPAQGARIARGGQDVRDDGAERSPAYQQFARAGEPYAQALAPGGDGGCWQARRIEQVLLAACRAVPLQAIQEFRPIRTPGIQVS
jgi:hypothetical protein